MEEQKNKEVKMGVIDNKENQPSKYTPEQLKDICDKLFNENQYLKKQLQQAEGYIRTFNRLDYLFRVVEASNKGNNFSFDVEFVNACISEIQEIMTPPEETKEEDLKEN